MAAVSHGMEIAQIEALGNKLQHDFSQRIGAIATELQHLVGDTSPEWIGPDAEAFRSWWPAKRAKLTAIAENLHGFGQSALNNASEQKHASGVAPSGVGPDGPAPVPTSGQPTAGSGALPGSDRTWQDVEAAYRANWNAYGLGSAGAPDGSPELAWQCVAWAKFRMMELGYPTPPGAMGSGALMAGKLGGTPETVPTAGAVMSYGSGWGHVVIAEDVRANDAGQLVVRVSEMNSDRNYEVGTPSEYRTREIVLTEGPDGQWRNGSVVVTTANPGYGAPRV